MRLAQVEFSNYRSIRSEILDIDPFATALMGRNDVGKSNILSGIHTLGLDTPFDRDDRCKHAHPQDGKPRITFRFTDPTDEDSAQLQSLPIKVSIKSSLKVVVDDAIPGFYQFLADEKPITSSPDNTESTEATPATETPTTESPQADSGDILTALWKVVPETLFLQALPPLPAAATIDELLSDAPEFETARRILKLGGIRTLSDLREPDDTYRRDNIKDVSERLTELLRRYWKQDAHLALELANEAGQICFSFREQTTRSTLPSFHSEATSEFLTILVDFLSRIADQSPHSYILLIDEPGIRMHPGGQRDLLTLLTLLAKRCQIVYTSHTPYLVDRNYPREVRIVSKDATGTKIQNKPSASNNEYYTLAFEPLQRALGLNLGDSLSFNENNVIVEGPSDQILILGLSQLLAEAGDPRHLNLNATSVIPAGSCELIETLTVMTRARGLNVVALYDSDEAGQKELARTRTSAAQRERDRITESPYPRQVELLSIDDAYAKKKPRSIEDLFPTKVYLEAVDKYYGGLFPTWSALVGTFRPRGETLGKALELYFKESLKGEFGGFDKVRVASEAVSLLRTSGAQVSKADGSLRSEFEPAAHILDMMKDVLEGRTPNRIQAEPEPRADSGPDEPAPASKPDPSIRRRRNTEEAPSSSETAPE
ncbi:MAG: AAA family ATPase [Anaerolineales bacterium]|jgi:predicted ATPase